MLSLITLATSLTGLGGPSITYSGIINSPLMTHVIEHEIMSALFSLIKGPRKSRLSRAQSRKMMNRRRRWFTDNIIMHHKRLHDRNREIIVASTRERVLAKKAAANSPQISASRKWRDRVDSTKERGHAIRGRIDARRSRARSRWVSVQQDTHEKPSSTPKMIIDHPNEA